jgi:threonyl-tRNA synthetase
MRVRGFTQDDAHIFCTEDQIERMRGASSTSSGIYRDLGFENFDIKLSTRPDVRVGSDEIWDKAESALEKAILSAATTTSSTPAKAPSTARSSTSS